MDGGVLYLVTRARDSKGGAGEPQAIGAWVAKTASTRSALLAIVKWDQNTVVAKETLRQGPAPDGECTQARRCS
jgi:hypothetical protein